MWDNLVKIPKECVPPKFCYLTKTLPAATKISPRFLTNLRTLRARSRAQKLTKMNEVHTEHLSRKELNEKNQFLTDLVYISYLTFKSLINSYFKKSDGSFKSFLP